MYKVHSLYVNPVLASKRRLLGLAILLVFQLFSFVIEPLKSLNLMRNILRVDYNIENCCSTEAHTLNYLWDKSKHDESMTARYKAKLARVLILVLILSCTIVTQSAYAQESDKKTDIEKSESQEEKVKTSSIPKESYPDYPAVGINKGVWNEGKAALWDLSIIDQYKITGADERAEGYRPEQPINFSHILHVQKNKMECQYCHWSVAEASYAALPDAESCMGCHAIVKGADEEAQKEIAKIEKHYNENKPVEWIKVHVMPDHYKFNHKRHVKGGVSCHECHGQIPEMAVVERASSMKMGWCIDCHRAQGSSIDCATCHY